MSHLADTSDATPTPDERDWRIFRYLSHEMSAEEQSIFESELAQSPELAWALAENAEFYEELQEAGKPEDQRLLAADTPSTLVRAFAPTSVSPAPTAQPKDAVSRSWITLAVAAGLAGLLLIGSWISSGRQSPHQPLTRQIIPDAEVDQLSQGEDAQRKRLASSWLSIREITSQLAEKEQKQDDVPAWIDLDDQSPTPNTERPEGLVRRASPPDWLKAAARFEKKTPNEGPQS